MIHKPVVVGIGELVWDVLPTGKRAGGAPINVVYHASKHCADGYAVSAVGNDRNGDEMIAELQKKHIKYVLDRNNYPTSKVIVNLKNGTPFYTITENTAWDHIRPLPQALFLLQKADAVCYGSLAFRHSDARAAFIKLIEAVPEKAIKFFDINLRQNYFSRNLIDILLKKATILKINHDEIKIIRDLFGFSGTNEDICKKLMFDYKLTYLAFTAGENYSIIYSGSEKSYLPTPKVKVKDTVGAGDAFSGAFICSVMQGKNLKEAHITAVETAAFVCTKSGAWPDYEDKKDE